MIGKAYKGYCTWYSESVLRLNHIAICVAHEAVMMGAWCSGTNLMTHESLPWSSPSGA
jgi:hypothetical protein